MRKLSDKYHGTQAIDKLNMDFISIECLEKLSLDQNPFIDHARDPFLFTDKQLEMSMNVLMDYLLNKNSTVVLLGEVGIGKTTHLRMLLRKGYQQFNFCTLRAKPKITFDEIEQRIKGRWRLQNNFEEEISDKDIDNGYLTISEHINKYIENNKQPVLIIDDAHRLKNSVLDEILKLKHHVGLQSPHTLGLVLASEPALQIQLAELERINPAATQIYQIHLRTFDANQCEEYIQYRMDKAGAGNKELLNSEKITDIYIRSKGIPKDINKLAREEISRLCDEKTARINTTNKLKSSPTTRLGLILAGLIGLAAVFIAIFNKPNIIDAPVPLQLSEPMLEQKDTKYGNESSDKKSSVDEKLTSSIPKTSRQPITKPYVAPLVLGPIQVNNSNTKTQDKKSVLVKKTETTSKQSKNGEAAKVSPYSSDWILEQDPNAFTIQIVASTSEKNLLSFAKKNSLNENTAYYKKTSGNENWFVLVHGIYKSREDALRGIESLTDSLKKNTPYPTQIKYLQENIREQ